MRLFAVLALVLAMSNMPALAQDNGVRSPVLTIESDRLYEESMFGQRVLGELRTQTEALQVENEAIVAELTAEESALTAARAEMDAEAFRAAADAFDARVQAIRLERDGKEQELLDQLTTERDAFFAAITPVLAQLMDDANAAVILERRSVFVSVGAIDITDAAIAAIDAAMGDGTTSPDGQTSDETQP